ncbi:RING-H2 finger protein ATL80 [Brachypodium distachyon]|uniref:RING-type E3 ubiquitin transferase n=1 Tax=Brachypodium distachyon TaxID=15368 RepID=A0A0Q3I190_BRADI|nr:RING-H2 finger protein ATL80 [Brachypodium distachyon]KQJ94243.1 hypothetical protein BRADI_3g09414v3 [Brachypodium distachyon]|eukprot:XP_010236349.1 RING-H2 finger protein ATL80 [Brachypodium distachyon]
MLNLYPRGSPSSAADEDNINGADGYRVFYGIGVLCTSIFLFCVLVASASVAVWKAFAFAAVAALLLGILGCFAPSPRTWVRGSRGRPASALIALSAPDGRTRVPVPGRCACASLPAAHLPPAFAYTCPPLESVDGKQQEQAMCCSVCLEDVRGGEMVRRLSNCGHVFHVKCIDMWLHSHRTCPMCRCVIAPPPMVEVAKGVAVAVEGAPESSDESLPPV